MKIFHLSDIGQFIILIVLLSLKLLYIFYAPPLPDEAYYWLWSKNLDWSYYDHPPLSSWINFGLMNFIENRQLQIRILPFFCFIIILIVNVKWVKHLGLDSTDSQIKSSLLFLTMPMFLMFTTISFPDAILVLMLFLTSYCFFRFIKGYDESDIPFLFWYLSVIFFALSCISKYNAIVYGVGVLLFSLLDQRLRKLVFSKHLIFGTLIFLIIQSPIVFWNIKNDLASFNFHLNTRLDSTLNIGSFLKNNFIFFIAFILVTSPIYCFRLFTERKGIAFNGLERKFFSMGIFVLIFTLILCIFLSSLTNVLYYWSIVGLIILIPFTSFLLKEEFDIFFQSVYGICFSIILVVNSIFFPISAIFNGVDRETAILYGWEKIDRVIHQHKIDKKVNNIVFSDYRLASLYSFHSGDGEVDAIMERRSTQFDIWRQEKTTKSQSALILVDDDFPLHKVIIKNYKKIIYLQEISIFRLGKKIKSYNIYLGKN
ncbi:glycosyltransferase family 39 protein [Paracoccaceae bacterium]|nr:glycosyltransferase family 39 protein [Paracoccaceae bacterium]